MSKQISLESGNTLDFSYAPFQYANTMVNVVRKYFAALDSEEYERLEKKIGNQDFHELPPKLRQKVIMAGQRYSEIFLNTDVQKAIIDCFQGCTYNSEPLTMDTFDNVEARADFDEILMWVYKENQAVFQKKTFVKSNNTPVDPS